MSSSNKVAESQINHEALMDLESQHMIWEKGITTVSFFSGDKPNLTSRLLEIVKANPWLVSTLIRNKKIHEKNIILCYPSGITEEHIKTVYHERYVCLGCRNSRTLSLCLSSLLIRK
mmetsp:Transcript_33226/g.50157  ORF Transcript_33226/g.50157 Transcript_33226/m.50157 type:complete len:117 (-) Transcript_33226:7-357(-)